MREILFRGKRKDNGEWVYGAYGNHTSLDAMIIDRPYPAADGDLSALGFWPVHPDTVGQYTGLTDKNGVKIFEGDICRVYFQDDGKEYEEGVFVVKWHKYNAMFSLKNDMEEIEFGFISQCEIIGNIHDATGILEVQPLPEPPKEA